MPQELTLSQSQVSDLHASLSLSQTSVVELKFQLAGQAHLCQVLGADVKTLKEVVDISRQELAQAHEAREALQVQNGQLKVVHS